MKRKSGFTLVEMLIVIVIIGILSSALLPRLTGYMARSRDLKRQMDLRNIATAIEMYASNHGELPFFENKHIPKGGNSLNFMRKTDDLKELLSSYISEIPRDPNKNTQIDVCNNLHKTICKNIILGKGNYLYKLALTDEDMGILDGGEKFAILVAKTETPDYSNYIIFDYDKSRCRGCSWNFGRGNESTFGIYPDRLNPDFLHCDRIEKGEKASIEEKDGSILCTYSSADQLYYLRIIK